MFCVSFKFFLFCSIVTLVQTQDEDSMEVAIAELEIANLELQDDCENLANTLKSSLISNTFNEKITAKEAHGELLKRLSENLLQYELDTPPELLRNWTFLVKSGDGLLKKHEWSSLVKFDVNYDELMHTTKVHCKNESKACVFVKTGFENIMESSRNLTLLKKSWKAWQSVLAWKKNKFPEILNLVKEAASKNGVDNARAYWEMLTDKDDSYIQAEDFWDQIKPLYFNLQKFVKDRLFRFYNISSNQSEIPVYLLGSNLGNDWSPIADIILPHPFLYHLAESHLNKTNITDIYKVAEKVTTSLGMGSFGAKFWANSLFNLSFCENHVLSHCVEEYSELLTCEKTSWTSYLDSFEVAVDVSLRNTDYLTLAQSRLRDSVLDEALKGLGSIFAVNSLRNEGVWKSDLFLVNDSAEQVNEMTELLLTALRVLPKLPYYIAADKWRLDLLDHGFENFAESWWSYRREYQGVEGISNEETDFLGDPYIRSNKPYLSKFLGIVLQFQLLNLYKADSISLNQSYTETIGRDENFLTMLHKRSSTEWPNLLVDYFSIYDLSVEPLLDYFAPLQNYFESAPLEQVIITTTPASPTTTKKLQLEKATDPKALKPVELKTVHKKSNDDEPPLPPRHEHVEENLEGPNPAMENIATYVGIALLVVVACIVVYVIVYKRIKKKKRGNNRRFET